METNQQTVSKNSNPSLSLLFPLMKTENNQRQTPSENPSPGVISSSEEKVPSPTTKTTITTANTSTPTPPSPPPPTTTTKTTVTTPTTAAQAAKLYECNFCKKGFSNAQALGGHMNIHRKDKAKLKQASKENQRLMDGQKMMNPLTFPASNPASLIGSKNSKPLEFPTRQAIIKPITTTNTAAKINNNNWPPSTFSGRNFRKESYESHVALAAELKQLPLFVETAPRVAVVATTAVPENMSYTNPINSTTTNNNNNLHHHHLHRTHAQASWQDNDQFSGVSSQESFGAELDLELRLGHEPPKRPPTVASGTRKFF